MALTDLEKIPSSEFKTPGWRSVLDRLTHSTFGALAITSHRRLQGVLLTTEEYSRLVALASRQAPQDADVLSALQREFDDRLASLEAPDAAERMRKAVDEPLTIDGKFRVGESH